MSKFNLSNMPLHWRIGVAFAAIYLIWGSTYLAIRFAIETVPPYLMGGLRFLIAGGILYVLRRSRGVSSPSRHQWRSAFVVGGLLLFGGNGGVMVAEQLVPSSIASLIIATVPLWMVMLNWKWGDRARPGNSVLIGLGLGVVGITLIAAPGFSSDSGAINLAGVLVLVLAALSWAIGSLYSRKAQLPTDPLMATASEILAGGGLMLLAALLTGQGGQFRLDAVTFRSLAALAYLVAFGSLVGFTAYVWLLKVSTPARVSTYAFVNPVIAVFLGWALAGEALSVRTLVAAAVIVAGVVLITTRQGKPAVRRPVSSTNLDAAEPPLVENAS
jgi:drug/metabolite transporter (DMT)-like permease